MMVSPSARRLEKRRQIATGNRPQSSSGNSAWNRRSSSSFALDAGASVSLRESLADAMMRSRYPLPAARLGFSTRQQTDDLFPELDQGNQSRPRHAQHLHVPAVDKLGES